MFKCGLFEPFNNAHPLVTINLPVPEINTSRTTFTVAFGVLNPPTVLVPAKTNIPPDTIKS